MTIKAAEIRDIANRYHTERTLRAALEPVAVEFEKLQQELAQWQAWSDEVLPEDDAIQAAFPTRSGDHRMYAEAMRLVGARRSKGALVALVNWLLVERDKPTATARWVCHCTHAPEQHGPNGCTVITLMTGACPCPCPGNAPITKARLMKQPVVSDRVQYFRRMTPSSGPAIGGRLEAHAAVVIHVRNHVPSELKPVDLQVLDSDGSPYVVRHVGPAGPDGPHEGVWAWPERL
jgi:hypothetical protein